jgi:class 3 adenylate cyclase
MEDRLPRKLAAILYADVAGYSRLTGDDEDATHRTLSEYLDLVSSIIENHRGQVMHYAGDAVLARFDAVLDTLSSAADIQTEINSRNESLPDERRVRFRIGVNLGDVIEDRGDIYGDGVNVAARLEALAEPGGICISDAVRTALGKKLPFEYVFIGEQAVKNIDEPVRAYRVFQNDRKQPWRSSPIFLSSNTKSPSPTRSPQPWAIWSPGSEAPDLDRLNGALSRHPFERLEILSANED